MSFATLKLQYVVNFYLKMLSACGKVDVKETTERVG